MTPGNHASNGAPAALTAVGVFWGRTKRKALTQLSPDLMEQQPLERLRHNATKCRDLAGSAMTPAARDVLTGLAEQYEEKLVALEATGETRPRRPAFKWPLS